MLKTKLEPLGGCGVKYYTLTISKPNATNLTITVDELSYTNPTSLKVKANSTVSYMATQSSTTSKNGSFTMNGNKTLTITRNSSTSTSTSYGNYQLDSMWTNYGASFDSTSGYLGSFGKSAYVSSSSTPSSTTSWTVSISFKLTSTSGNNAIFGGTYYGWCNSATCGYSMANLRIVTENSTLKVFWGGTTIASGTISASSSFKTITVTKNSTGYRVSGAISGSYTTSNNSNWSSTYALHLGLRDGAGINPPSKVYGTSVTIDTANSYITTTSSTKYFSTRSSSSTTTTYYLSATIS